MQSRIVKKLGEGAYGKTYLIEQRDGQKFVLKKPNVLNKAAQEQAKQERTVLEYIKSKCRAHLICINRVKMRGSDIEGLYLEYLPGTYELYDFIKKNQNVLKNKFIKFMIMASLLQGLALLHKLKVAHRDIKPENILLNPRLLQTHYIDYGTSCLSNNITCLQKQAGTLDYIAPELWKQRNLQATIPEHAYQICKAADVWALGMVFNDLCFYRYFEDGFFEDVSMSSLPRVVGNITSNELNERLQEEIPSLYTHLQAEQNRENSVWITLILRMLNPDWTERPTASGLIHYLVKVVAPQLGIGNVKEMSRKVRSYALAIRVVPGTKIFPGPERPRRRRTR